MTAYVALIRAVNVGGRQLNMADLKVLAESLGYGSPRTFIASGNLLFVSKKSELTVSQRTVTSVRIKQTHQAAICARLCFRSSQSRAKAANVTATLNPARCRAS